MWSMSKRRREEGGFPGAERIQRELRDGPSRVRVGIKPEGKAPAREGTEIVDAGGNTIGAVTSGGFGPSAEGPVAMGYVQSANAEPGSEIGLKVGDVLEVYDSSRIIEGVGGQRFITPGLQIGEVEIVTTTKNTSETRLISGKDIIKGSTVRRK